MKFCVVVVLLISTARADQQLPDYIKPCPKNDLKECAIKHGTDAIPSIVEGDEAFGIPNMKPLQIPEMTIPNTGVSVKLADMKVYGLDGAEIKDIDINLVKNHAKLVLHMDNITIQGNYEIDGRILLLPISGNGRENIGFENGDYTYEFDWSVEPKDGVDYAKIQNSKMDYRIGNAHFKLENLFDGNKFLGDRMNEFLNANWKEISTIFGPTVKEIVGNICNDVSKQFFERIPFDQLFV